MITTGDTEGDAARARFLALLDSASDGATQVAFWWRDDDAAGVTPALSALLKSATRHRLPLGLAVIPGSLSGELPSLTRAPHVYILQHGWRHTNHSPAGEKKAELGNGRPLDLVLDELRRGSDRLRALFPGRFLPVLVPPWNRVGRDAAHAGASIGLPGLSTFGDLPQPPPHWVNTHLDIFRWKPQRRPLARTEAFTALSGAVQQRLAGDRQPIGILTHHLVHEPASWALLDELFEILANHPAVSWPTLPALFGLEPLS